MKVKVPTGNDNRAAQICYIINHCLNLSAPYQCKSDCLLTH
jgi:hypothetical protein